MKRLVDAHALQTVHELLRIILVVLAEKYEKNIAQIILRYDVQNGIVTIPKSTKEARILSNSQVFDFELSTEDIEKIDALNKNEMHGDPDHVDF